MTRRELERGIKTFDLQKFFLKDTSKISEYSAILVITDNQLILTENGDHGRLPAVPGWNQSLPDHADPGGRRRESQSHGVDGLRNRPGGRTDGSPHGI